MARYLFLPLALILLATSPSLLLAEEKEAPKKALYLPLADKFVVNVQDGKRMRFMQVKVQVMTREERVFDAIGEHLPALNHAVIMLLSHQDADTMRSAQGREQVRIEAQREMQQVLAEVAGLGEGLEAVYFTDFVIQ
ncbi:MAG: flagellar basal body-associated FliL family protein [Gammaproteobacteria bacterium]|nr:flagellar basal body-associated FliL family protein [Gammaproteobacteria bacterium]